MVLTRMGKEKHDSKEVKKNLVKKMFTYGCHCWPDYPENKKLTGKGEAKIKDIQ